MTEQTRALPNPFNQVWQSVFNGVCESVGESVDMPRMPTNKELPLTFTILWQHWVNEYLFAPYYANRDVKARLCKEHLNGISEFAQLQVVAVWFDGHIFKIDGHSRAAAWNNQQLVPPKYLKMTIFKAETLEEVATIYRQYNSRATAATAAENSYHAHKLAAFEPNTAFMKKGWATVYPRINPRFKCDENLATRELKPLLEIIDSWNVHKGNKKGDVGYPVGVKVAMLWSLMEYGEQVKAFWDKYADKEDRSNEGLAKVREHIIKENGNLSGSFVVTKIADDLKMLVIKEYQGKSE